MRRRRRPRDGPYVTLSRASRMWIGSHRNVVLLGAATAFVAGFWWNIWIMAFRLGGHHVAQGRGGTTATADGKAYNVVFWFLFAAVPGFVATYVATLTWRRALRQVAAVPRALASSLSRDPGVAAGLFLWGVALSLVGALVLTQAMVGVLAGSFLLLAPTLVAALVDSALIAAWAAVVANITAHVDTDAVAAPMLVMLGHATGMVLAFVIGDSMFGSFTVVVKVLLALVIAVVSCGAVVLRGRSGPAAVILLVAAAGVGTLLWRPAPAAADTGGGGWRECRYDGHRCRGVLHGYEWLRSEGAGAVLVRAVLGGAASATGAVVGITVGGGAGRLADAPVPTLPVTEEPVTEEPVAEPPGAEGNDGDGPGDAGDDG